MGIFFSSTGLRLPTVMRNDSCVSAIGANQLFNEVSLPNSFPRLRMSRSLKRISRSKRVHNTTVVNESFILEGRSDVIEQVDSEFTEEAMLLNANQNEPIGRRSSPQRLYCFKCEGGHEDPCTLYEARDGYAQWRHHLERAPTRKGHFPRVPEAISGAVTPAWFPKYLSTTQEQRLERNRDQNRPAPAIFTVKQLYMPGLIPGKGYSKVDKLMRRPTPRRCHLMKRLEEKRQEVASYGSTKRNTTEDLQKGRPMEVIPQEPGAKQQRIVLEPITSLFARIAHHHRRAYQAVPS